jgi:hypothetical protein
MKRTMLLVALIALLPVGMGTRAAADTVWTTGSDLGPRHESAGPHGSTPIPDNDPAGVLLGPISIESESGRITDLVLEVDFTHPSTGEIRIALGYDENRDGALDVNVQIPLYLARLAPNEEPLWGCPLAMDGKYYFRYEPEAERLEGWEAVSFSRFLERPAGGDFFLRVVDEAEFDVGVVENWAVFVRSSEAHSTQSVSDASHESAAQAD